MAEETCHSSNWTGAGEVPSPVSSPSIKKGKKIISQSGEGDLEPETKKDEISTL